LAFGLNGVLGHVFKDWRWDLIRPDKLDRLTRQVQSLRFIDFLLLAFGVWGVVFALRRLFFSLATVLSPQPQGENLAGLALRQARLKRGPRVVCIGGGTGLPHLLKGLKKYTSNLTAVVTVADDGGSSGRLRRDLKILPPGDLRNCLVALAETEPLMAELFQHRFKGQGGLEGHSFGNLFIAALAEVTGDFGEAIRASSKVLAVTGRVLPVTLDPVRLEAEMDDGRWISGESKITATGGKIRQLRLYPRDARPNPEALDELRRADAIVMGPGSLYTSILPNLLVPGVAEALRRSRALKIYVCNIMTQPGETDGYSVSDHLKALERQTGYSLADYVIANSEQPDSVTLKRYAEKGQAWVELDREVVKRMGLRWVKARLMDKDPDGLIRHHSERLARALMRLIII
jgi:uncharacterized cofD-like protein